MAFAGQPFSSTSCSRATLAWPRKPRTGRMPASAGREAPPRTPLKLMLLGEAVTLPLTKPSGIRASTSADSLPSRSEVGRKSQRTASSVKPSTEQVAALPDHNVPETPAKLMFGGANQRSAVPAGNVTSVNAMYAPTPKANHDQRLIGFRACAVSVGR
jgi:hypothetical protein